MNVEVFQIKSVRKTYTCLPSIGQSLYSADLKQVLEWHTFQNGTQCQSRACFRMAHVLTPRNTCNTFKIHKFVKMKFLESVCKDVLFLKNNVASIHTCKQGFANSVTLARLWWDNRLGICLALGGLSCPVIYISINFGICWLRRKYAFRISAIFYSTLRNINKTRHLVLLLLYIDVYRISNLPIPYFTISRAKGLFFVIELLS